MAWSCRLVVAASVAAFALARGTARVHAAEPHPHGLQDACPSCRDPQTRPARGSLRSIIKLNPRYLDLLQRYARGERPAAIVGLAEWSEGALLKQVGVMEAAREAEERCIDCPKQTSAGLLRAAIMLHADRDKMEKPEPGGREETPRCPGLHARIARRYAEVAARDPETRDFSRRFYLTMALLWQHKACFEDALIEARAGLELFPRDGLLMLTAGSVLEERAILTAASGKDDGPRGIAADWLKEAQRDFTDAIAHDPDLTLARVKLGWVLWRLGEADAAREALEAALPRAREADHRYLASLFLGRLHQDAQRLDEAVAAYRQAVAVYPQAQSAAVALSHALQLLGEADESRRALAQGVAEPRRFRDPYSDYLAGNTEGADRLEDALHREALE